MPRAWADVANSTEFRSLSATDQEAARQQYFQQVVEPEVGDSDVQDARSQFDQQTRIAKRDLPADIGLSDAGAGRGSVNPPGVRPRAEFGEGARRGTTRGVTPYGAGDERVAPPPEAPTGSVLDRPVPGFQPSEADLIQASKSPTTIAAEQAKAAYAAGRDTAPSMTAAPAPSAVDVAATATRSFVGDRSLGGQAAGAAVQKVGDLALSTAKIAPETLKLASDIVQLGTGGWNAAVSQVLQNTSDAMTAQQSAKLRREHGRLTQILRDPNASVTDVAAFLASHPEYSVNAAVPSLGSMAIGAGGGRLGAAAAESLAARRGASAAGVAAATDRGALAGTNAANALMNAGDTFAQTDGDLGDKYTAAAIAGGTTAGAGRVFEGGAEGALARHATAASRPRAIVGTMLKEGGQEATESLGQQAGQAVGEGKPFDANAMTKQAAVEGGLGAITGAGAGATLPVGAKQPSAEAIARSKGFLRPVEVRKQTTELFEDLAATHGMTPKAAQAVRQAADKVPLDELPGFFKRAAMALSARGLVGRKLDDVALSAFDDSAAPTPPVAAASPMATSDFSGLADVPAPAAPADEVAAAPAEPAPLADTPVDQAAHAAATSPTHGIAPPTEAQKRAGNYTKGHVRIAGLDISIENPQGSMRSGTAPDGTTWATELKSHYGYVKGTLGADGDHVDVFVKPGTPEDYSGPVFVVDQVDPKTGAFDEHKAVIGAASREEASALYHANYDTGWRGAAGISEMPLEAFKSWVRDGAKKKPLTDITGAANGLGQPADAGRSHGAGPADRATVDRTGNLVQGQLPGADAARPADRPAPGARRGDAAVDAGPAGDAALSVSRQSGVSRETQGRVIARYGKTPNGATDIELRANKNGTLTPWAAGYEMVGFESGDPITLPAGTTDEAALSAIRRAGSVSKAMKMFPVATAATGEKTLKVKRREDGTVLVMGDPTQITAALPEFKGITGTRGITYGRTIADKVVAALDRKPEPVAQPARKTAPTRSASAKARMAFNPETDTVLQALAKMGGLSRDVAAKEFGLKPEELTHTVGVGNLKGYPFRARGGRGLDSAIEALQEAGYFPGVAPDDVRSAFEQAIYDDLSGKAVMTPQGDMKRAADAYNEQQQAEQAASDEDAQAEREAIMAEAGLSDADLARLSDDDIDIDAPSNASTEAFMRSMGFTDQEIADELAREEAARGSAQADPAEARATDAGKAPAADGARGEQARPGATQEGLTLQAQTEADLQAKTERDTRATSDDAARQKALADKARADAQRGDFTLTGSDRAADVAAAAGQRDLLEPPSARQDAVTRETVELRKRLSILKALRECLTS